MKNILSQKSDMELNVRMRESVNLVLRDGVSGKTLLDIGCGYGWFEYHMLKKDIKHITGVEITENDLVTAQQSLSNKNVAFVVAGALKIPLKASSMDIVVAWEVLEHIPKFTEVKMFKEVHRVLKPGGRFYLSTPYNSFFSAILDPAWWLIGHRHYDIRQLHDYATSAGLRVINIHARGGIWSITRSLNMYISKWVLRRRPVFDKYFSTKEGQEYKEDTGTATLFAVFEKKSLANEK